MGMYEKIGGRNGRHQAITYENDIGALSYLAPQIYEEDPSSLLVHVVLQYMASHRLYGGC